MTCSTCHETHNGDETAVTQWATSHILHNPSHSLQYGHHISGLSEDGWFVLVLFLVLLAAIFVVYNTLNKKIESTSYPRHNRPRPVATSMPTRNDKLPTAEELASKWGKKLVVLDVYTATEKRCEKPGMPTRLSLKFEQFPDAIGRLLYYRININDSSEMDIIFSSDKNRVRKYKVTTGLNKLVIEIHGSEQIIRKEFNVDLVKNDSLEIVARGDIFGLETTYKG